MSSAPRIYVLLPVHNRRVTTEGFIRCLLAQTYTNWQLVLVDDGSQDGTEKMARALVPSLTVLRGAGNWWWAGSLHQGYEWLKRENPASDDLALIMNDDTAFEPDFLANAVRAMKPRSLLVAQAYKLATGEFCEAGVFWDWRGLQCRGVREGSNFNCFSTRGLFLHVETFMKVGGFHPRLLPHYLSDYEFTIRAHRKGFALISSPDVFLHYDEMQTGIRSTAGHSFWKQVMMTFSVRSASNPVYWTSFVLLASPKRYLPVNLLRVWSRAFSPIKIWALERLAPGRRFLGRVKRKVRRILGLRTG